MQDRRRLKQAASFVVAFAEKSIAPFSSPLIEPDVTISVIRLSDGFHMEACAVPRRGAVSRQNTPNSPKMRLEGNCRKPDPATLCRR